MQLFVISSQKEKKVKIMLKDQAVISEKGLSLSAFTHAFYVQEKHKKFCVIL